jgi:hypothetical protein
LSKKENKNVSKVVENIVENFIENLGDYDKIITTRSYQRFPKKKQVMFVKIFYALSHQTKLSISHCLYATKILDENISNFFSVVYPNKDFYILGKH